MGSARLRTRRPWHIPGADHRSRIVRAERLRAARRPRQRGGAGAGLLRGGVRQRLQIVAGRIVLPVPATSDRVACLVKLRTGWLAPISLFFLPPQRSLPRGAGANLLDVASLPPFVTPMFRFPYRHFLL